MIALLRGSLVDKEVDHVVLDVSGVGYRLTVSAQTLAELPPVGQTVQLHTYLVVREDALTLFGFGAPAERTAFELCLSVQQVGPKLAMSILSTFAPADLARAIRSGDVARLVKVPGVGKKTAERLALELRDKVELLGIGPAKAGGAPSTSSRRATAVSALTNLGYRGPEAERAVDEAIAAKGDGATPENIPEIIKDALRRLAEQ